MDGLGKKRNISRFFCYLLSSYEIWNYFFFVGINSLQIELFRIFFLYCQRRSHIPTCFTVWLKKDPATEAALCRCLFSIKLQALSQHRCFPVNTAKFLRTAYFIEHLWWLLLSVSCDCLFFIPSGNIRQPQTFWCFQVV